MLINNQKKFEQDYLDKYNKNILNRERMNFNNYNKRTWEFLQNEI